MNQTPPSTLLQKMINWAVPIGIFLVYFLFYNFGKVTPSEIIKSTGLCAIALLSITLAVGSLSRFIPAFNELKQYRKSWGIASFVFAFIHGFLVLMYFFKWDYFILFNVANQRFFGLGSGLLSLLLLLIITATSYQILFRHLPAHIWKYIQNLSYLALFLAVTHFFLMEQKDGVLIIKRLLGQITYWFSFAIILLRLLVLIFPKADTKKSSSK